MTDNFDGTVSPDTTYFKNQKDFKKFLKDNGVKNVDEYWDKTKTSNPIAVGASAIAKGERAFANGDGARAIGDFAIAIGKSALAKGYKSKAIGIEAIADGDNSVATGFRATAKGSGIIATVDPVSREQATSTVSKEKSFLQRLKKKLLKARADQKASWGHAPSSLVFEDEEPKK